MDRPEVKFGDKLFLYGQYMSLLEEFDDYDYNSVMGYMTVGGFAVYPVETVDSSASVPGFVVEISSQASSLAAFTATTPFSQLGLVDVTDKLARSLPLPTGTKIWMPTKQILVGY